MAPAAGAGGDGITAVEVARALNAAQDGGAAAERAAAALWRTASADPDGAFAALAVGADQLVAAAAQTKSPYLERAMRYFSSFAARAPANSEAAAALLEELLARLAGHLSALQRGVRFRAAQLIANILGGLPATLLLEDSVAATLRDALVERLMDKAPAVRAEACHALGHLATDDDESGRHVVDSLLAQLAGDKNKDVRVAAVAALPLNARTLPAVLGRLRDTSAAVRRRVLTRLEGVSLTLLSIEQRAYVLQTALRDREQAVADAMVRLLGHWLANDCGGDPLRLLQRLDVETHCDAALLAIENLLASGAVAPPHGDGAVDGLALDGASAYVQACCAGRDQSARRRTGLVSLRELAANNEDDSTLLAPHEALMWRCLCQWLRSDAINRGLAAAATGGARAAVQAATAAERHEVLERALPDAAKDLLQLLQRHALAGPAARFAATQLAMIAAACVDWADVASRDAAAPVLEQLMALQPGTALEENVTRLDDAGMPLAGDGGDHAFEGAVATLALAVAGGPGTAFVQHMLSGVSRLAAVAGVPSEPLLLGGSEIDVSGIETAKILQCLSYVRLLLEHLPSGRGVLPGNGSSNTPSNMSFAALWRLLLALALKHPQPAVRALAIESAALYALAAAPNVGLLAATAQLLGRLVHAGGALAPRVAAVRGLADLALVFGPAAINDALRAAVVPQGEDGAVADPDGAVCLPATGADVGVLELLVGQAEAMLATAKLLRSGGAGGTGDDDPLPAAASELLPVLAESLCKLLLHQRAWMRAYGGDSDGRDAAEQGLRRALALLLLLTFHPAAEGVPALRQCLAVFFDVFAVACGPFRLQLAAAALPAARAALHVPGKRNAASTLLRFVAQLLSSALPAGQEGTAGAMLLALSLLREAEVVAPVTLDAGIQPSKYRPYLTEVLRLVGYLPLGPEQAAGGEGAHEHLAAALLLADRLQLAVLDAALKREATAVTQLLQSISDEHGPRGEAGGEEGQQGQLGAEQLDALINRMHGMCLGGDAALLPPLPGSDAAAGARARRGGGNTTQRRRRRGGTAAATSSDEDSSTDDSSDDENDDHHGSATEDGCKEAAQEQAAPALQHKAKVATAAAAAARGGRRQGSGATMRRPLTGLSGIQNQ